MKKRAAVLLLCLATLNGCRSFDVRAFGQPLNAAESGYTLTKEEKWAVILLVAVAVGGAVALAAN